MKAFFSGIFSRSREDSKTDSGFELDQAKEKLQWIYGFWNSLAPYAYARKEDCAVILPPNLVYKTNETGASLIAFLDGGGRFEDIPGFSILRAQEIHDFFVSIQNAYLGRSQNLERVPYDFQFTRLPVLGELAVTYRCNHRCRFCYAGCGDENPKAREPELDTQGMKKIIDLFRHQAKIPFFSFTGGEPLLRPDLEELAAYACGQGLRINLITNGTLATPERARSLFQAGFRTAQVSLEASEADLNDDLCGAPGAFEAALKGIKALQEAGISVQTNSTLTRKNRENLLLFPEFLKTLGVSRFSMNLFIPVGSGAQERELVVPYTEAGSFVDRVRKQAQKLNLEFFWYSPIPLCLYNPIARGMGNKSCAACDGLISVSPMGEVLPCSSWPVSVGNLLSGGFEAVWFGEKSLFLKQKKYASEACQRCDSFTACQAACPLYWQAMGMDEICSFWKTDLNKEKSHGKRLSVF